jgi:hypothetical protein
LITINIRAKSHIVWAGGDILFKGRKVKPVEAGMWGEWGPGLAWKEHGRRWPIEKRIFEYICARNRYNPNLVENSVHRKRK